MTYLRKSINGGRSVGLIALFHLLLVYPRNLGKKGWKVVEYFSLVVAALGLISICADIRIWLGKYYLKIEEMRTVSAFENIQYAVLEGHPSYICVKFERSEFSPENFEEIQQEYDRACDWYEEISKRLPDNVEPDFPELKFSSMPHLEVMDPILKESKERVKALFESYMNQREKMIEVRDMTQETGGEGVFLFFHHCYSALL